MRIKTVTKHHYCCFGTTLGKVIEVEWHKHLGTNFRNGGINNCHGLTMEEIQRLDFSKMDFSEFMNELMVKFTDTYKTPKTEEVASTIITHMNIK